MNYDEKSEFLEFALDLARNLEDVTEKVIEVLIGWIETPHGDMRVSIMVNHPDWWFGCFDPFENQGWNIDVIRSSINKFTPVHNDYLALNELIEKAYNGDE